MAADNNSQPDASALLTTREMYRADALTIEGGVSGATLMEAAGAACARAIREHFEAGRVIVMCGNGNNGGDGFVIARLLKDAGWNVCVGLLGTREALAGDAATAAAGWTGDVKTLSECKLQDAGLIVDALLGAGLSRPVEGELAAVIDAINASPARVCAVDVPSGVDGNTGAILGVATKADVTVTFFRKKPGHVLYPGRALCGDVVVADIGISASVLAAIEPRSAENGPSQWSGALPVLEARMHKYNRGHAVVVSGGPMNTGAARLGARAALRSGAGLVTVVSPSDAAAVNASHLTAIMLKRFETSADLARVLEDRRMNAVLIGPAAGVGGKTRGDTRAVLSSGASTILDADALTSFAQCPEELFTAIASLPERPVVLTPHDGEFAQLFPEDGRFAGRIDQAVCAAAKSNAIVVLKAADTVIATPDGCAMVNTNAPPDLATAGSGDVLAGLITGLLAQGMMPYQAACAAVWLHGETGALAGRGLIAEDLPDMLPQVMKRFSG